MNSDYHIVEVYADTYTPLSIQEYHLLLKEHPENTPELLVLLIKHNSRAIYSLASKYRSRIAFDDALSIGIAAAVKLFETKWDRTYTFSTGMHYAIRTALRVALRGNDIISGNTGEELDYLTENACYDDYDDHDDLIWNAVKEELTEDELQFIRLIYVDGLSISKAGRIVFNDTYRKMSASRHQKLLKLLKKNTIIEKERYE